MEDELYTRLNGARERVRRMGEIAAALKQMQSDKEKLEQRISKYKDELAGAGLELYKLESKNASIFDSAKDLDKRLIMERNNTAAARLRCGRAEKELRELVQSIEDLNAESQQLAGSDEEYESLYEQKKQKLIAEGGDRAQLIIDLSGGIDKAKARLKKINDACKACETAVNYLQSSQKKLEHAKNWGTVDMLGGKFGAGAIKHSHISSAVSDANSANVIIRDMKYSSVDAHIGAEADIKSTGSGRAADIFMDNAFTDMSVQSKINSSLGKVSAVKTDLQSRLCKLTVLERQAKNGLNNMQIKLDSIILS